MAKTYNLALLGFGNVGRQLADLLERKRGQLLVEHGIEFCITGVATRRLGWIADSAGVDTAAIESGESAAKSTATDVREWLRACQAHVLFETTSLNAESGEPAITHLRAALEHGAHAITANKGPVVHAHRELSELAQRRGKKFLFESTVMDGGPIFSLFETLPLVEIRGFRGVLNSTTNVILGEMERGLSLEEGIARAQRLGVAESDPTDDLNGTDAAVKTLALANVLMHSTLHVADVDRTGIDQLTGEQVRAARASGTPYKLVCRAVRRDGVVHAIVRPEQLPVTDPLAAVEGTSSVVYFETDIFPGLAIVEDNPGLDATAYGLLADFIRAVEFDRARN